MTALRNVGRELVEKRLWPVAALLVIVLIAIPVLFKRPAPAALEASTATGTPAATGTAAPAAAAAAAPTGPTGATGTTGGVVDPSVAMTSSPFAAAFGSGLDLPPSMEGLLKATKGTDDRKTVRDAALRDPFAFAASTDASAGTGSSTDSQTLSQTPPASATTASAAPRATTAPTGAGTLGGGSASTPTPAATTPSAGADSAPAPDTSTSPSDTTDAAAATQGTTFHADVQFGTTGDSSPLASDAQRLTAFPSAFDPVAVYLGVMRGGWGAVFALREDVRPVGAPSCRPRKQICSWVILHIGESVDLAVKDPTGAVTTTYTLKLAKISREELASDEAKAANARADAQGRCLLGPLAAYKYDTDTGTLAARPELKDCEYRTPGQAETASVRVAHIG